MRNVRLSIPPDIHTEYEGGDEYADVRIQPLLTEQEDYRERTVTDVTALIERTRQLGPNMYG